MIAGRRLGVYEIVSALGSGGMGEVYRARDTKLGRDVAIKVLPAAFTSDPDRLARFDREARVLASLNHPNIGAIYGVEHTDGIRALVLELVEGATLAEKLAQGPGLRAQAGLAVKETLTVARQIAHALEAAHEKGVVHRDLKPANVKVTHEGVVKVLDFGLAKLQPDMSAMDSTNAPTAPGGPTLHGVVMGTAPYMSPEQARGQSVDKRADIWAFGCVLFELLTGRRAFGGATTPDIIAAILEHDPHWAALPHLPSSLLRLMRRCLEKDVKQRLRDIGDARLEIEEALGALETVSVSSVATPSSREIEFRRLTDFAGFKESPAISPDGKMVAFVAIVAGRRQIWIRLIAGGALLQLTRDDVDHEQPRWAPDSSTLIYYSPPTDRAGEGTIWEIGALGGWPRRVASAVGGADISHDGRRIALVQAAGEQLALTVMARDGSSVERVAVLAGGSSYMSLRWSPDDRSIAFQRWGHAGFDMTLEIVPASAGEFQVVSRGLWLPGFSWLPDGSGFVYSSSRGSTLLYPPVGNLRAMARDGSGDRRLTFGDQSYVDPDVHATGKLLATLVRCRSDVWKFPVGGSAAENTRAATRITRQTGQVQTPSVSPDGSEVVYLSDNGGHGNLWIARTDGSATRQLTFEWDPAAALGVPKWSPRGDLIAFVMTRSGLAGLWVVRPDGSGLRHVTRGWAPCWSSDGRWLYYWWLGEGAGRIEKTLIDGGEPQIVREEDEISIPDVSSDGSALFFVAPVHSNVLGAWNSGHAEIRCARPERGPSELLVRIPASRISGRPGRPIPHVALSPDGQSLATSLVDGATTNLWIMAATGGSMRAVTDFGDRAILITRSLSWSHDSQSLYAAVAEIETDIVLIDGLIQ